MEIFLPTLETKITSLVLAFRFIVFALMVVGLIAHMSRVNAQGTSVFAPLVKAIVIVTAIASLDLWFPKVDQTFLAVADTINPGYSANPTNASDKVRESITTNPEGHSWSWRKLNESIYQAIANAISSVFIFMGTLLTVPMLILQYILKWLLYLLAPFALGVFMLPGCSSIGARFFQQLLAVHAWPVGFAITDLVALAIWKDFISAVDPDAKVVSAAAYSPLLIFMGGMLATIVIVVGMISTPIVMQKLFVQGIAFSGAAGNPASIFRAGSTLVRGTSAMRNATPAASVTQAPVNVLAQNVYVTPPTGDGMRLGI